MKPMKYIIFCIFISLLLTCNYEKIGYSKREIVGAWALYALNLSIKDSICVENRMKQKQNIDFLEVELRPFRTDTLPNKNIQISYYAWYNNTPLPNNTLVYHTVLFDSIKIVGVLFEDYGVMYIDEDNVISDNLLWEHLKIHRGKTTLPLILEQAHVEQLQAAQNNVSGKKN